MKLYHYFEKENGHFCNLSDLSLQEAEKVLEEIKKRNQIYAAKRDDAMQNSVVLIQVRLQ